jgi:hypothetical protein
LSAGLLPIAVLITYTSYELTVTILKSWQSASRTASGGSPYCAVRLCTQISAEVVIDSEPEVVVTSAVVVASELAMEETISVTVAEDAVSGMEVSRNDVSVDSMAVDRSSVEELPGLQGPATALAASATRMRVLRIMSSVMTDVNE